MTDTPTTTLAETILRDVPRYSLTQLGPVEGGQWLHYPDVLAALTAAPGVRVKPPFHFDRYINGILMAEGVTIEREGNIADAMRVASRIASKGPNGETPVLVLAALEPAPYAPTRDEAIAKLVKVAATQLWGEEAAEAPSYLRNFDHAQESSLENKARSFLSLTDDWDGDGAKEIPIGAVYGCLNFLSDYLLDQDLPKPTGLSASPDGEIVVYWHAPKAYAEINFTGDGEFSICTGVAGSSIEVLERPLSEAEQDFKVSAIAAAKSFLKSNFLESTKVSLLQVLPE